MAAAGAPTAAMGGADTVGAPHRVFFRMAGNTAGQAVLFRDAGGVPAGGSRRLEPLADLGHLWPHGRPSDPVERFAGAELENDFTAVGAAAFAAGRAGGDPLFSRVAAASLCLSGRRAVLSDCRGSVYLVPTGSAGAEECRTAHRAAAL